MKHLLIKYNNGATPIIHFEAIKSNGYTLCGHDTYGDGTYSANGWGAAKITAKRVTCERCQEIVKACKAVKDSEISNISRYR